ncbi:hypothetical protein GH714_032636 [Hevea brasiliensis]|uniref:Uncharacterized protein n=1 Tax=Hevea brasiliensis TaxID=3981 RepID=A0A6A6L1Y6_HEVBR|nr:hypothetical protein GH714_032636 [Hevea brasiliensis]
MGQSASTANSAIDWILPPPIVSSESQLPELADDITADVDYTEDIPDECLAYIFQFLSAGDRKRCSLVCRRWLLVDGNSRQRLSLHAKVEIFSYVPSLFTRFDSVTKLALRCDRKSISLNDDAFVMISVRCQNLERLKLRGCREITDNAISKCVNMEILRIVKTPECSDLGLVCVAENCKQLRKLHIDGWRANTIGDVGLMAVAKQCPNLQELVLIGVNATHASLAAIAANCQKLERLALCGSGSIGDNEITCIAAKCVALKKLCIKGCAISDIAIQALAWGCPNLVKIKVKQCRGVSSEFVECLQQQKASLLVNIDAASDNEGLDVSLSDGGGQESGLEFPVMGGQVAVADGPSIRNGRPALFGAKVGLLASRNLVARAFSRWSSNEDGSSNNNL